MIRFRSARVGAVALACTSAALGACGSSTGSGATPKPVAQHSATPLPTLPTQPPTATPTPALKLLPLKDYAPTPAQIGKGFFYKPGHTGAPLPAADVTGTPTATWEVLYQGPGQKLVVLDVSQFAADRDAYEAGSVDGQPEPDPKTPTTQLHSDTVIGYGSWYYKAPANGNEFYAVVWVEGPLEFQLTDRDVPGVLTLDDAIALAKVVDARTH